MEKKHSEYLWHQSQKYADYCETYLEDPDYDPNYEYIEYLDDELEGEKYHHEIQREKNHICPICNAGFTKSSHMKRHITSVHEGTKPYPCSLCETRFAQNGDLQRHMKEVHEKIKRHKCPHCEATFAKTNQVKNHIASIHDDKRPFACPNCEAAFKLKHTLAKHIKRAHEGIKDPRCEICSARRHRRIHQDNLVFFYILS